MAYFSVKKRAQKWVINVRKLVDEKIIVVYEDFNDGKISFLTTYKQNLENKLEKYITFNKQIWNVTDQDEDYESEGDVVMEAELKIWESLENLRKFLSTKSKLTTCNLHRTDENSRQFNQVKLPKFEIKAFSGNPVEWKTFIESFTATVDKNISICNI